MLVAIGTDPDTFGLPPLVHFRLLELFWRLVNVHDSLWQRNQTRRGLEALRPRLQKMMVLFRKCFQEISKSHCRNTKYHNLLHVIWSILMLGSARVDTRLGEQANRVVKHSYRGTNRKLHGLNHNMFMRGEVLRCSAAIMRGHGMLHVSRGAARVHCGAMLVCASCVVFYRFCFFLTTPACFVLPCHRPIYFSAALEEKCCRPTYWFSITI
jgi:hypothetical protein